MIIKHELSHVLIRRNRDPHGWLSNMYPIAIVDGVETWPSAEAYFQAQRVKDDIGLKSKIRRASNAMKAKQAYKKGVEGGIERAWEELSWQDVQCMIRTVGMKIFQNQQVAADLQSLRNYQRIIEDVTHRRGGSGLFWGAARVGDYWIGANVLGLIWETHKSVWPYRLPFEEHTQEVTAYIAANYPELTDETWMG